MQCKYCKFSHSDTEVLVKHYRLRHGQGHKGTNWPCLYPDCVCSFRTQGALKSHLSRCHTSRTIRQVSLSFKCVLRCLKNVFSLQTFSNSHNSHLRKHETVRCPFAGCEYKVNRLTNFTSHRNRKHKAHTTKDLRNSVITETENLKGIVHFEIKIWYLSAYPKGIQDVGVFFSSVDPILMFLGQTVLVCQSYNGRYRSLSL